MPSITCPFCFKKTDKCLRLAVTDGDAGYRQFRVYSCGMCASELLRIPSEMVNVFHSVPDAFHNLHGDVVASES